MGLFDKIKDNIKTEQSINKKLKADELSKAKQKVTNQYKDAGLTDKEVEVLAKKNIKAKKQKEKQKKQQKQQQKKPAKYNSPDSFEVPEFKF